MIPYQLSHTTGKREKFWQTLLFCAFVSPLAFGLQLSTGPNGSNAQAIHELGFRGQQVNIGLISIGNILSSHEAFTDELGNQRAFNIDIGNGTSDIENHDTNAAGIAIARGCGSYPDHHGVAPAASLYSVDVIYTLDYAKGLDALINNQQCRVVMTVIQNTTTIPNGENYWPLIYDYYAFEHNVIFANAAGNFEEQITAVGDAYNGITTGGLRISLNEDYAQIGSGSNPGTTYDGRRKPEIASPAQSQTVPSSSSDTAWTTVGSTAGQTSWAVPQTAGVAALLVNYADQTPTSKDNENEVIKAAIINATFPNIADRSGRATTGLTWHPDRGYGRLDALRALTLIQCDPVSNGEIVDQKKGWSFDHLGPQQTHSYTLVAPKHGRLVITVTWNRRVEWIDDETEKWYPDGGRGLIERGELESYLADIDMNIYDPDNNIIASGLQDNNNLEKADILLNQQGPYRIEIANYSSHESADYGLAFEVIDPLPGDMDANYIVDVRDLTQWSEYWLNGNCDNPENDCYRANISPAGIPGMIELNDFSGFSKNWMQTDPRYYTPE